MVISKFISIRLNGRNSKRYESLGYLIPRRLDNRNVIRFVDGTEIQVKVEHLPTKSNVLLLCECDVCGKKSLVKREDLKFFPNYKCSPCFNKLKETRERLRKLHTGTKQSDITKQKRSILFSGKGNPNYNPTITDIQRHTNKHRSIYPGYPSWLGKILKRDNYTCQACGSNKHLCVHHINCWQDFVDQRVDINNGIVLCKKHHKLFHKMFGLKHTTRNMFEEFMKIIKR